MIALTWLLWSLCYSNSCSIVKKIFAVESNYTGEVSDKVDLRANISSAPSFWRRRWFENPVQVSQLCYLTIIAA